MTADTLVLLMLLLLPQAPRARLEPLAQAIVAATDTADDAVVLAVISYYENSLGAAGVPFGACSLLCAHRCSQCRSDVVLSDVARWSIRLVHRAEQACHVTGSLSVTLGWYHTGRCEADPFSRREEATYERLRTAAADIVHAAASTATGASRTPTSHEAAR